MNILRGVKRVKRYKINWSGFVYGTSFVEAETEKEAWKKVGKDEDKDFEETADDTSWEIDDIVEVDDNDNEI